MELHDFITLIGRKRKTVYSIIALFLILAVGLIAVQRFKYSSKSQVLVVQEYNRTLDAYTVSKSNEYLSSVLANVIASNSFFTKVTDSGFDINAAYFGDNAKDQMKEWEKTVSAQSINDSGIISITVYHPDRTEAEKIVRAINHVLMTQHTAYHGSGEGVKVRLIDQPVTSNFPVKPNILLTMGAALTLGFLSSLLYIYLSPQNKLHMPGGPGSSVHLPHRPAAPAPTPRRRPDAYHNPAPRSIPYQRAVEVRGQAPEEAIENFDSHQAAHHPHVPLTSYGQHAQVALPDPNDDEGGYLEDYELSPEELAKQGNIRNVLT